MFVLWKMIPYIPLIAINVGLGLAYYIGNAKCQYQRWDIPFVSQFGRMNPEASVFSISLILYSASALVVVLVSHVHYQRSCKGFMNNLHLTCCFVHFIAIVSTIMLPITDSDVRRNAKHAIAGTFVTFSLIATVHSGTYLHKIARSLGDEEAKWFTIKAINAICTAVIAVIGMVFYYLKHKAHEGFGMENFINLTGDFGTWQLPNGTCLNILQRIPTHIRTYHTGASLSQIIAATVLLPIHILCHSPIFNKYRLSVTVGKELKLKTHKVKSN